eukprot:2265144-Rhodomonas_salina.5
MDRLLTSVAFHLSAIFNRKEHPPLEIAEADKRMTTFSESDIREAFQTFDRDGNGFIGASDLHNTYLAINENLTDDEVPVPP